MWAQHFIHKHQGVHAIDDEHPTPAIQPWLHAIVENLVMAPNSIMISCVWLEQTTNNEIDVDTTVKYSNHA